MTGKRLPYQGKPLSMRGAIAKGTIPAIVGEATWQGYAECGHGSQSCERVHERGGFSLAEIGYFLAVAVDAGRVEIRVVKP